MNLRPSWFVAGVLFLGVIVSASCQITSMADVKESIEKPAYFVVRVHNEEFIIAITDESAISDAMDSMAGRKQMFPIGKVALGNGGFNIGYSWHLTPESVRMTEVAMELCDGLPSYVEKNPEGWASSVKYFCPWNGRVVKRFEEPSQYVPGVIVGALAPALKETDMPITAQSVTKFAVAMKAKGVSALMVEGAGGWLQGYINNNTALKRANELRYDPRLEELDKQTRGDFVNEWGGLMFSKAILSRDSLLEEAKYLDGEQKELSEERFKLRDVEWGISVRKAIHDKSVENHNDEFAVLIREMNENNHQIEEHNKMCNAFKSQYTENQRRIEEFNRELDRFKSQCRGGLPEDEYDRCLSWQSTLNQRAAKIDQTISHLGQRAAQLDQRAAELNKRREDLGRRGTELDKEAAELNGEKEILLDELKKYEKKLREVEDWAKTLKDELKSFRELKIEKWVARLESFNARLGKALNEVGK